MRSKEFTLIELLIVVTIISILAAIVIPNFLSAQVRSKVSRVKGDLLTFSTGLESYNVDNNAYPPSSPPFSGNGPGSSNYINCDKKPICINQSGGYYCHFSLAYSVNGE